MDEIFENWSETKAALLEGLDAKKQQIVGPLLENQKNQLLSETAAAGAVQAHDIAGFRKILIPMVRRIIPGTIGTELVGVQPMTGPVGLVYTLRYRYQEAATSSGGNVTPFDSVGGPSFGGAYPPGYASGDELWGNVTPIRSFYSGQVNGPGSPLQGTAQPAGASGIGHAGADGTSAPPGIDSANAVGEAWGSSQDSTYGGAGSVDGTSAFASGLRSVAGSLHGGSASYLEGSGGRKVGLEIINQAVEAGSRKLQAGWTIEAMQDLNSQHGLDLESELTQAMSAEIVQEIDAEIIADLLSLAGTLETFDGAGAGAYGTAGNYTPAYVGDRLANLGVIVNRVANEIGRKTRRGVANWMVVSPLVVSVLQSAAKSVFAPAVDGSFKGPNNTMLVGTLNGMIKVYSYIWNQAGNNVSLGGAGSVNDVILVGYKGGNGETDSGYFYCPYIPLMSSGVIVNPVTFQPVVSLMTRYGKTTFTDTRISLGNSADYYGKITVNGLDLV